MTFPKGVAENLLVACHRHCCICHKPAGTKMEIHHIKQKKDGGEDTEENGIPLCLDCHVEAGADYSKHTKGRKFTENELKRLKEQWFAICASSPWQSSLRMQSSPLSEINSSSEIRMISDAMFSELRIDDRRPAQRLVGEVMMQKKSVKEEFVKRVLEFMKSENDETRWKTSFLVEEILLWEPKLLPLEIIENMSRDKFFSVRSSAAVCYNHLAQLDPASVPLDILSKLATCDEDWYVATPATNALLKLARTRPVVIDIIARGLESKNQCEQEYAVAAIKQLAQKEWNLLPYDLLNNMKQSSNPIVKEIGEECLKKQIDEPSTDYGLF
jgi:hypothetical protein